MAGGVATIASTAAASSALPVVGWVVGGALVLGLAGYGGYRAYKKYSNS
jgi:hypothetical protein